MEGNGCFRPKVVYNAATRRYVLWINTPDQAGYRVLTASSPSGPFTLASTPDLNDSEIGGWDGKPTGAGDENLFVDRDGTGWLVYNRGGTLLVERLAPDYLSGAGQPQLIHNYPEIAPFYGVEAPSMFERGGTYYITMSLARCPYCQGTGTGLETAPSAAGPWTYVGLISQDSCRGQPNGVAELPGGVYLYSSDQWVQGGKAGTPPRLNETDANQFWAPLAIEGQRVLPISCSTRYKVARAP